MNNSVKSILTLVLISLVSLYSFSQTDSTKIKKIDGEKGVVKSTNRLKANTSAKKVNPQSPRDLSENKKINVNAIDKKLKEKSPSKNNNFLMETLPEDNDIIGVRYWKGKDVTHKKLVSNYSLGTIKSTSGKVRVECRDHLYIDGDRIKIYHNEKVVSNNIGLKGNYYVVFIDLVPGYNRVDFQALNQGFSGPNTAEVNFYDDKGTLISAKKWNISTGQTATLGIIKY